MNTLKTGWKWLLGSLLTLLGFSNVFVDCKKMYGCPTADYKLTGDVTDKKGSPIEGIRVIYSPYPEEPSWKDANDTLYTDTKGHFSSEHLPIYEWPESSILKFEDIDGSENGSYKTRILTGDDLVQEQTKKGDRKWYTGEFTIHADVVLEEDQ